MKHELRCCHHNHYQAVDRWHHGLHRVGLGWTGLAKRHTAAVAQAMQTEPAGASHSQTHRYWQPLDQPTLWQGTEAEALTCPDSCFRELSPTWKVMLLSDGSVTRHLQLLTGQPVHVECLEMVNIGDDTTGLPSWSRLMGGPRVQRTVLLKTHLHSPQSAKQPAALTGSTMLPGACGPTQGQECSEQGQTVDTQGHTSSDQGHTSSPLVYAVSWWDAAEVDKYLVDKSQPIWVSLSQGKVELHRKVLAVQHGHNAELEKLLGCPGPFWGRHYLFTHGGGKPLTLIYEVFSPHLTRYLGPTQR